MTQDTNARQIQEDVEQVKAALVGMPEAFRNRALHKIQLVEDMVSAWGSLVDMSDISAFDDTPSTQGSVAGAINPMLAWQRCFVFPGCVAGAYINEVELRSIRAESRAFSLINPYWIGAKEARLSYIIGKGHTYKVMPKDPDSVDEDEYRKLQDYVAKFLKINKWNLRQEETVTRLDRDGERFLRYFPQDDGTMHVRFVEPLLIQNPPGKTTQDGVWFGIKFDKQDFETPEEYYVVDVNVDGNPTGLREAVTADKMQHLKANVDMGAPRGLPTTYALRPNMRSAIRTLNNMGKLVEFRSRIGMIKKRLNAIKNEVEQYVAGSAVAQATTASGRQRTVVDYPPGAVIEADKNAEYDFPAANLEIQGIVGAIQADLRASASALQMPEYMLTGDASNANYASTMVAEGPSVKRFERDQNKLVLADVEVIETAISHACDSGLFPEDVLERYSIEATAPNMVTRDRLKERQCDQIDLQAGVMSKAEFAARDNLVYSDQRDQIEMEQEQEQGFIGDPNQWGETGFADQGFDGQEQPEAGAEETGADEGSLGVPSVPSSESGAVANTGASPEPEGTPSVYSGASTGAEENPEAGGASETGGAAEAPNDYQRTALNGAQTTSLREICKSVTLGELPPEAARMIILISFPMVDEAYLDKLIQSLSKAPQPKTSEPSKAEETQEEFQEAWSDEAREKALEARIAHAHAASKTANEASAKAQTKEEHLKAQGLHNKAINAHQEVVDHALDKRDYETAAKHGQLVDEHGRKGHTHGLQYASLSATPQKTPEAKPAQRVLKKEDHQKFFSDIHTGARHISSTSYNEIDEHLMGMRDTHTATELKDFLKKLGIKQVGQGKKNSFQALTANSTDRLESWQRSSKIRESADKGRKSRKKA